MDKEEVVNLFKQFTNLAVETNADNVNLTTYTAKVLMEYIDELQEENKKLIKEKMDRLETNLKFYDKIYNKGTDTYEYYWNKD